MQDCRKTLLPVFCLLLAFYLAPPGWALDCSSLDPDPDTLALVQALYDTNSPNTYYLLPWINKNCLPITIDGNINDSAWSQAFTFDLNNCTYYSAADRGLEGGPVSWTGPDDLGCTFYFAYDDDALYVAFDRTDDVYVNDLGTAYYLRDSYELMVDPAGYDIRKKIPGTEMCVPAGPLKNPAYSILKLLSHLQSNQVCMPYLDCMLYGATGATPCDLGGACYVWDVDGVASGDPLMQGITYQWIDVNGDGTHYTYEARLPFSITSWQAVFTDRGWPPGMAPSGLGGQFAKICVTQADDDQVGDGDPALQQATTASNERSSQYQTVTGHGAWDDPFYWPKFLYGPHLTDTCQHAVEKRKQMANPLSISIKISPNPFKPSTLLSFSVNDRMVGQNSLVSIYDVKGKLIRHLYQGKAAKTQSLTWNGTDNQGRRMAAGLYLYRVLVGDASAQGQLLLSR